MDQFSSKSTVPDTHTRVNVLDLDAFNYNRFTWWFHIHKTKIIFLIFITVIVLIGVYVGEQMNTDQCTSDKAQLGIWFGVNTILVIFTYLYIWPHTQWKSLSPQSSKFLGTTSIARQQAQLSHQIPMETPTRYLNAGPEQPTVQSIITPIPQSKPIIKIEEPEELSWFRTWIDSITNPESIIPS
jgi:uncharacterized membrane protein (DUF485 family)